MAVIVPGALRVVITSEHPPAIGGDAELLVQQTDGSWVKATGVCEIAVTVKPDDFVRARIEVELSALDLTAWPEHIRASIQRFPP